MAIFALKCIGRCNYKIPGIYLMNLLKKYLYNWYMFYYLGYKYDVVLFLDLSEVTE